MEEEWRGEARREMVRWVVMGDDGQWARSVKVVAVPS